MKKTAGLPEEEIINGYTQEDLEQDAQHTPTLEECKKVVRNLKSGKTAASEICIEMLRDSTEYLKKRIYSLVEWMQYEKRKGFRTIVKKG